MHQFQNSQGQIPQVIPEAERIALDETHNQINSVYIYSKSANLTNKFKKQRINNLDIMGSTKELMRTEPKMKKKK